MHHLPLQLSDFQKEGAFQASKWLKIQALIDAKEMKDLLQSLSGIRIFSMRGVVQEQGIEISQEKFLQTYASWNKALQEKKVPSREDLGSILSCVWTLDSNDLYLVAVNDTSYLVKPRNPVVLVQAHFMGYSNEEKVFRPMILGADSIFWGLQFSFPQIFQKPDTKEFVKVDRSEKFRNTLLFSEIRKWMRNHTRPTPFLINQTKINLPIRLGKECFSWIQEHPQLQQKELVIHAD